MIMFMLVDNIARAGTGHKMIAVRSNERAADFYLVGSFTSTRIPSGVWLARVLCSARRSDRPAQTLRRVVRTGSTAKAESRPGQRPLESANLNPAVPAVIEASHEGCY